MEIYEDEAGPPTQEDDWWHHEHVRAAGYPKVKKGDRPLAGQMTIDQEFTPLPKGHPDYRGHLSFMSGGSCWCGTRHTQGEADALNA